MAKMPETLEEFFEAFPEIGEANCELVTENNKLKNPKLNVNVNKQASVWFI